MMNRTLYEDDPERERLRQAVSGDWFVFETFAADGSLAIGMNRGEPDPRLVLVVKVLAKPWRRPPLTAWRDGITAKGETSSSLDLL
jgi:hypothetical protein